MDTSEKAVLKYLKCNGYKNVVFEPDGNVPPDFIVNSAAIEVRRLNQNYFSGSQVVGLEEISIPLWHRIESLVQNIEVIDFDESWHVTINFMRPIGKLKEVGLTIKDQLLKFVQLPEKKSPYIIYCNNFDIELYRASIVYESYFICSGQDDLDAGGFTLSEMKNNIDYCIQEKSEKIRKYKHNYEYWWLALVDHISRGLNDHDIAMLREGIRLPPDWDKLIVINPRDIGRSFELSQNDRDQDLVEI